MNDVPSGCTGRGRGMPGRSRGRGITDGALPDNVPGIRSLNLNGHKNGYKEDVHTALSTVTSCSRNEPEVTQVLEKWLDLAETDQDIGEAVATAVCEMMTHVEYGDVIRANVMTRIYTMFEECRNHKVKSVSTLTTRFSFTGYMYMVQREPLTHKRIGIYDRPMLLYIQEILTHKLTEETVKVLTKQIAINGIALYANPDNKSDLESIFILIRRALLSCESTLRPYLLFLCDIQGRGYHPLSQAVSKFYAEFFLESQLKSYRPLVIDLKLYGSQN